MSLHPACILVRLAADESLLSAGSMDLTAPSSTKQNASKAKKRQNPPCRSKNSVWRPNTGDHDVDFKVKRLGVSWRSATRSKSRSWISKRSALWRTVDRAREMNPGVIAFFFPGGYRENREAAVDGRP